MELPKIKNEFLPKEIRDLIGDADAEFDLLVDPMDIIAIPEHSKEKLEDESV